MTSSSSYTLLSEAATSQDLLRQLKDLKNSVIGNTWRKVDVAEDEQLLTFLLGLLEVPPNEIGVDADSKVPFELISETAVIVGALATVGTLTLRPLLTSRAPLYLLNLITTLTSSTISSTQVNRLLLTLLRALRNILVSTADTVWGHMWGVGAERRVVGTGLVGTEPLDEENTRKGKGVPGRYKIWRVEASRALALVFEPTHLDTLLSLLQTQTDPQTLLPLYQLFARLVALSSHREALARWQPVLPPTSAAASSERACEPGPSMPRSPNTSSYSDTAQIPFIIRHLLSTVVMVSTENGSSTPTLGARKQNPKLVEAALDLLAALIKGQTSLAAAVRAWSSTTIYPSNPAEPGYIGAEEAESEGEYPSFSRQEFISHLMGIVVQGPTSVRIAAASCLTNIIKADKATRTSDKIRSTVISFQLLDETVKLLQTEGLEERVKLCFILAALVSDDATLQKSAAEKGCPAQLVSILVSVDQEEGRGELGTDVASRTREAALLALASLAMQYDPTRSFISDTNPSVLPIILRSLSHSSYGVRAAGCQLARALSRAVSLLRTTLSDSGIGEEVIRLLKREVEADGQVIDDTSEEYEEALAGDRAWTVEVAATATICNLIADFSPLKMDLLRAGGLELFCELTRRPFQPVALNALWAIKNLTFHATESTKAQVMALFGWDRLKTFLASSTDTPLSIQAFEITQNLLADATPTEISRTVDHFGENDLFDLVARAAREGEIDLKIPALYVLSNLALGNERLRGAIVARVEILEILSEALNSTSDPLKIPSLRCLRHLIESNAKTHRPRQGMLDLFHPYQLKPRLKSLAETSPSLDVCQAAVGLLEVLDRGRESGSAR